MCLGSKILVKLKHQYHNTGLKLNLISKTNCLNKLENQLFFNYHVIQRKLGYNCLKGKLFSELSIPICNYINFNFINRIDEEKCKIKIKNGVLKITLQKNSKKRRLTIVNDD